ncbi:hypothetical protein Ahy_A10g048311 [Arachis hypogaea]|uniref:Sucrose-phosphatase C-terminal domain-containing protein n=1 Tax=Arachis hypogaea TaxID=3818 RepID=A0A445B4T6_ARAHY|nr:hypothetical protein Ahy_A10g048311 [Arachis hypogaea]
MDQDHSTLLFVVILEMMLNSSLCLEYMVSWFAEIIITKLTIFMSTLFPYCDVTVKTNTLNFQVSNAQEELLQWYAENAAGSPKLIHATERCADGIIQAISKFSLGPNVSPRDIRDSMYNRKSLRPCHEVVMFYLFYERWRRAEVENSEEYVQYLKSIIHSTGNFVHPSGVDQPIHQLTDTIVNLFGDKQGVEFRVWVDRISTSMVSSGSWLVKFDKWELSGNELRCCSTKVLVNSKIDAEDQFTWMHIHQTWVDGFGEKDDMSWVI